MAKNDQPKRKRVANKSPQYFSLYANDVQSMLTVWDLRLVFGEIESATPGELVVTTHCDVVMSPMHAKSLLRMLTRVMSDYEKKFGPIRLPDEVEHQLSEPSTDS